MYKNVKVLIRDAQEKLEQARLDTRRAWKELEEAKLILARRATVLKN